MFFTISQKTFTDALNTALRAIAAVSPVPIMTGVLIEAKKDCLVLKGSESRIAIKITIYPDQENQLVIEETGIVLVEARYLNEIVKKMECEYITIETVDLMLIRVTSNVGQYNINGFSLKDYPAVDFSAPEHSFTLSQKELRNIIFKTVFACSDKDSRPVLGGVNFLADGQCLTCAATDSYRLAYRQIDLSSDFQFNITVPKKILTELMKSLEESDDPVSIHAGDNKVQFIVGDTVFQTALLDGAFPQVANIIPSSKRIISKMTVDAQEITRAIDRTNFIRNEKVHLVKLECSEEETRIKTSNPTIGNTDELLITARYHGEPFSIFLNGTYMTEAIRALESPEIIFEFTGSLSPLKVISKDDDQTLMVLVPVRSSQ